MLGPVEAFSDCGRDKVDQFHTAASSDRVIVNFNIAKHWRCKADYQTADALVADQRVAAGSD